MICQAVAVLLLLYFIPIVRAQSIEGLGVSGGSGPTGGIGDSTNPVLDPRSFITDAYIPSDHKPNRQLAIGKAPISLSKWPSDTPESSLWNVTIDAEDGARQEMLGFGHSWTDSAVIMFNTLESYVFKEVMEDLFGQNGNNMGFMRHTIGSSDLSEYQYSYDANAGKVDSDLSAFTLGSYGEQMAEMIAQMGDYKGDVFLLGSPWSYPGWAKNNHLFVAPGGASDSYSNNSFNTKYTKEMVEYFSKYIDAFQEKGVVVNAITPMNEPLNWQSGYPTMHLPSDDEADLIKKGLGTAMSKRNVSIFAFDDNTYETTYPLDVLNQEHRHVDGVAWHCYQSPAADYSVMDDIHDAFPNALQFMSECSDYASVVNKVNFLVARNFILPVHHGASAGSMWVMATNPEFGPHVSEGGCDECLGSIIVNSSTTYTKTNDYYMVGHFSRYVRRGAVNYNIITGNWGNVSSDDQFFLMAVKNPDKSWAVIFMNNMGVDKDVVLGFTGTSQKWRGTVPNETVVTWILPPFAGESATPTTPSAANTPASSTSSTSTSSKTASSTALGRNTMYKSSLQLSLYGVLILSTIAVLG
ncbi:putative beta-glucanase [Phaeomoniella chlamydospora]|uniref:Putative beta-glucanase n=1 Tax=Phaeomoniella chlamydospora TaxID=158046 RepID=A0A0G2GSD9_PHACM|nr:putative beta-glucanase [Phaeomoniella chlamydospora]